MENIFKLIPDDLLFELVIPAIPRDVQVAKAQKAKFYQKDKIKDLPAKYLSDKYDWRPLKPKSTKLILFSKETNQPVIKNSKTAGKPKFHRLSGNDVWDTKMNGTLIEVIKISLQEYFWEVVKHFYGEDDIKALRKQFDKAKAVRVHMQFYSFNEKQDADNMDIFYRKAFADAIQDNTYKNETRLVSNDRIIRSFYTDIIPVSTPAEEKLVICIYNTPELYLDPDKMLVQTPEFLKNK